MSYQRAPGETVYLSCAETAKHVRNALKLAFPGVKFSVRSSNYSGGASIDVRWKDGPLTKAVESVAKAFEGKTFDGMIDMATGVEAYVDSSGRVVGHSTHGTEGSKGVIPAFDDAPPNASRVHFGADYVFCQRDMSPETERAVKERVCKRFGLEPTIIDTPAWDTTRIGNDYLDTWKWRETSGYYDNETGV